MYNTISTLLAVGVLKFHFALLSDKQLRRKITRTDSYYFIFFFESRKLVNGRKMRWKHNSKNVIFIGFYVP